MKAAPKICLNCAKASITGGMVGYAERAEKQPHRLRYRYCTQLRQYIGTDYSCNDFKSKFRIRLWKRISANLNYKLAVG